MQHSSQLSLPEHKQSRPLRQALQGWCWPAGTLLLPAPPTVRWAATALRSCLLELDASWTTVLFTCPLPSSQCWTCQHRQPWTRQEWATCQASCPQFSPRRQSARSTGWLQCQLRPTSCQWSPATAQPLLSPVGSWVQPALLPTQLLCWDRCPDWPPTGHSSPRQDFQQLDSTAMDFQLCPTTLMVSILYGYVKVNSQAFPSFICVLMCTKFRVNLNLSFFINILGNFLGF